MAITEKIQQHIQELPAYCQAEVLDFVEHLLAKVRDQEEREGSALSLAFAMRGLEDESIPLYTPADLKVMFV